MKTEQQLYADDFAFRVWYFDPAEVLENAPADARAIVDAYTVAAIEARTGRSAGAR